MEEGQEPWRKVKDCGRGLRTVKEGGRPKIRVKQRVGGLRTI